MASTRPSARKSMTRKPAQEPMLDDILVDTAGVAGGVDLPQPSANYCPANFFDDSGRRIRLEAGRSSAHQIEGGVYLIFAFKLLTILRRGKATGRYNTPTVMTGLWMAEHIHTENIVMGFTLADIGRDLGRIYPCDVSQSITTLENDWVLMRRGRGSVLLNPRYCYFGPSDRQNQVCAEWDELVEHRKRELESAGARRRPVAEKLSVMMPA
jgi:hypothetical protein